MYHISRCIYVYKGLRRKLDFCLAWSVQNSQAREHKKYIGLPTTACCASQSKVFPYISGSWNLASHGLYKTIRHESTKSTLVSLLMPVEHLKAKSFRKLGSRVTWAVQNNKAREHKKYIGLPTHACCASRRKDLLYISRSWNLACGYVFESLFSLSLSLYLLLLFIGPPEMIGVTTTTTTRTLLLLLLLLLGINCVKSKTSGISPLCSC